MPDSKHKNVTVRAVVDGDVCQLVQQQTSTGIPCCIKCLKPIPRHRREVTIDGVIKKLKARPLFCTTLCAQYWAQWAAGEIFPEH